MKQLINAKNLSFHSTAFSILFILFWLFAAGLKLYDFSEFNFQMKSQVFSSGVSEFLSYLIPIVEISIAAFLVYSSTRLVGMFLSVLLASAFTIYVGLALLDFYKYMPCNCAGLLGPNSTWNSNFILNLSITVIAVIGLIITLKDRERRKQGMHTLVSHAPLPA